MTQTSRPRRRRGTPPQDGGSLTIEVALIFPAVLLAVFGAISGGLWMHARNIALNAAQEGVRVARTHADPGDATAQALGFANTEGGGVLDGATAEVDRNGETVAVTVRGQAISLLPGLTLTVSQTARGPVERFTTAQNP